MTTPDHDINIASLSADERYTLGLALLDSARSAMRSDPAPASHLAEIRRRVAVFDANPKAGIPWPVVRDRLLGN